MEVDDFSVSSIRSSARVQRTVINKLKLHKSQAAYLGSNCCPLNRPYLAEISRVDLEYAKQPIRYRCCNCKNELPLRAAFIRRAEAEEISYFICDTCGHVNGKYSGSGLEELSLTAELTASSYGPGDLDAETRKLNEIYLPKVEFLFDCLKSLGEDPRQLRYLDIGAAGGHFVKALQKFGVECASGIDINPYFRSVDVRVIEPSDLMHEVATTRADVISLLCVLPHLEDVGRLFESVRSSGRVRYVFALIPLFGFSVVTSLAFSRGRNQVLGGLHTHLHTRRSLAFLEEAQSLTRVGEWIFGTDSVYFYEAVRHGLPETLQAEMGNLDIEFDALPFLDEFQRAIDSSGLADQTHVVWKL